MASRSRGPLYEYQLPWLLLPYFDIYMNKIIPDVLNELYDLRSLVIFVPPFGCAHRLVLGCNASKEGSHVGCPGLSCLLMACTKQLPTNQACPSLGS